MRVTYKENANAPARGLRRRLGRRRNNISIGRGKLNRGRNFEQRK